MSKAAHHCAFLFSTVAFGAFAASAAVAQTAANEPAGGSVLQEVVVTANRQVNTVNKIAMSITAETQRAMDAQGLKSVDDLTKVAPALTIRRGADQSANISVRGIYSSAGAQTTGVYLDDTPLQQRIAIGSANGNGSPTPFLFDLDRVEVLRGPQGTLYGGSSLGGTIRFITPTPSLTNYSSYARAQASFTEGGDPSGEIGVAAGGPIVRDVLGFRASLYGQSTGGWIDHKNPYTGAMFLPNNNSGKAWSSRLALLWAPTAHLKVEPTLYYSEQALQDTDFFYLDVPRYSTPAVFTPNTGTGFAPYTYPSHTYGPISGGPNINFLPSGYPRTNRLLLPALNLEYDFGPVIAKSITSYVVADANGSKQGAFDQPGNQIGGTGLVSEFPNHTQFFNYQTNRKGITEELRFSSPAGASPLSYVGGLFVQHVETKGDYYIYENLEEIASVLRGNNSLTQYKAPLLPGGISGHRNQVTDENELAGFGEANYDITSKLKLTAGVRVSQSEFEFHGYFIGPIAGSNVISDLTGSATDGKVKETPVTYKFALNYQLTDRNLLYLTVAKGYRQGGVNTTQQSTACDAALKAYGGPIPSTYASDTTLSYEAGAKLRLFDRIQMNSSIYRIDWSNIQTNLTLPGCFTFVSNAAEAISQGFDTQIQAQVLPGLGVNLAIGYDDAHYSKQLLGPISAVNGTRAQVINNGDPLPVPPWTVSVGAQYDWTIQSIPVYVRGDYEYNSAFRRSFGPGTTTYLPDLYQGNETRLASARIGARFKDVDLSVFVDNLFNSRDLIDHIGGRAGCATAACTTYSTNNYLQTGLTFRPRTVGVTLTYRR